jgi:hypothetical protein
MEYQRVCACVSVSVCVSWTTDTLIFQREWYSWVLPFELLFTTVVTTITIYIYIVVVFVVSGLPGILAPGASNNNGDP